MSLGQPAASAGVLILDTGLIVRSWDPWLAAVTGIPVEAAGGRRLAALFPDLEPRGILARLQRVIDEGTIEVLAPALHHYFLRCPLSQPQARFTLMQQRTTLLPLRDGDLTVGVLVSIEDVTARLAHDEDDAPPRLEPHTVDVLTGALANDSWQIRRAAAGGLAQASGPDVVVRLLRAIRNEFHNLSVLNSALQALVLLQADSISPLAGLLGDPDAELRVYATLALGLTRDPAAIPPLVAALADPDTNVRYHAIEALGNIGAGEAVDALMAVAETRDFFLAFPALDALAAIGDGRVAGRIVALLEDDMLGRPAVDALGRLGDDLTVPPLVELLNQPGPPVAAIAQALVSLQERYEHQFREGAYLEDLTRAHLQPAGVANLLAALDAAQPAELATLVTVLGWLREPAAEAMLARLLGRPEVRREVVEALVRHGSRVTDLLIGQLLADDLETRQAAVIALGRIGDARAVPDLTRLLTTDHDLMVIAAGALARIGDRRPFEALIGMIDHPDASVRQAVVAALNSLGHPDLAARVAPLLHAADPHVREAAVKVAGYFGFEECVEGLLAACDDPDDNVRRAAVEHLPFLEDPRAVVRLIEALQTETPRVQAAAARALGHAPGGAAIPPLLAALGSPDAWVRYAAARALGQQAAPDVLDRLAQLVRDDSAQHVRIAAMEALGEVGGPRVVAILAPMIEAAEPDLTRAALRALGRVGHPDALPPLLAALQAPDPARRSEAARALAARPGPTTTAEVQALQWAAAGDQDREVARAAVDALARRGTPDAIAALIALTTDPTRRDACVAALAGLHDTQIEEVARGLTYPQPAVRRAVVEALAQMKRPQASALLGQALDHPDPAVRTVASLALGRLGSRQAERKLVGLAHDDPEPAVRRAATEALHRSRTPE